jgi:hypothetical protein
VAIRPGLLYGTIAGIMLLAAYTWYLARFHPLYSLHSSFLPVPAVVCGVVLWLMVAIMLIQRLRSTPAASIEPAP